MPDFLQNLGLTDSERSKLAALGAQTPLGLLSMRQASKETFDKNLGAERADTIARALEGLLSDDDRSKLAKRQGNKGAFGARLNPRPNLDAE